jgi:hypothetical protein
MIHPDLALSSTKMCSEVHDRKSPSRHGYVAHHFLSRDSWLRSRWMLGKLSAITNIVPVPSRKLWAARWPQFKIVEEMIPSTYLCVLRREFSGMTHWQTINFIIPPTPTNPSIPYVKRSSQSVLPGVCCRPCTGGDPTSDTTGQGDPVFCR